MPAIIHCIRHAQGFHNLGAEFYELRDPCLTPLGDRQCQELQSRSFPAESQRRISLVTASPLARTLQTAFNVFRPILESHDHDYVRAYDRPESHNAQILAIPDAQETSDYPCDTGSELEVLVSLCEKQKWPVDLSLLKSSWNLKSVGTRYSPHSNAIKARACDVRILLRRKARELESKGIINPEIVLVAHGGFLHYFTGDWEDASLGVGTGWSNCETRAFAFEMGTQGVDPSAKIVETMESRRKRGKESQMGNWEEQKWLFEKAMRGWESQGWQRPDHIVDRHWLDSTCRSDDDQQTVR